MDNKMNPFPLIWNFALKWATRIFLSSELRRLRARASQLDSLLRLLKSNGYVVLDPKEKFIISWALRHYSFAEKMKNPKMTTYRLVYRPLKDRFIKETEKFDKELGW